MERLLPGVRRQLAHPSLDVHLWDITTDVGMPVVLCLARSRNDGTMSLGASAHLDVATAINKAVVEAFHGYVWGSSILAAGTPLPEQSAIRNPGDHFAYFLDRARQGRWTSCSPMGPRFLPTILRCASCPAWATCWRA